MSTKEKQGNRRRALARVLKLGLLAYFIVVVPSACGGGSTHDEAGAPKIPEASSQPKQAQRIPPGKYVSDEFRPAMSFRLGEDWTNWEPGASVQPEEIVETRDSLSLFTYEERNLARNAGGFSWLKFMVVRKIFRFESSYEARVEPAPDNMVAWLQNNPRLKTEEPHPAIVGGEKGMQFDAVVSGVPQDYYGPESICGEPCLMLVKSSGLDFGLFERSKARFIVLDDVRGETVTIAVSAPAAKFDEFWLKARKVIKTVKWKDA